MRRGDPPPRLLRVFGLRVLLADPFIDFDRPVPPVRAELRERAEAEAIRVFRANLGALLMQPPFGQQPVIGLDPGLRTGCLT